jgi:3-phenylpropionate/trans-cinnamate dioxygenase ferredoxin subunit
MMDVAAAADIPEGGGIVVQIGGQAVYVCKADGVIHALHNECPHAQAPLSKGRIRAGSIMCREHGARFNLATGAPMGGVFCPALTLRRVTVAGERVMVE